MVTTFRDALWVSVITFFTIGYGDFYPISIVGRLVAVVTCFGGLLYAAVIIGLVTGLLGLTSEEMSLLAYMSTGKKEKKRK